MLLMMNSRCQLVLPTTHANRARKGLQRVL